MKHMAVTFNKMTVDVDQDEFAHCTFNGCIMLFSAAVLPKMTYCEFDAATTWQYRGHAAIAIPFLHQIAAMDPELARWMAFMQFPFLRDWIKPSKLKVLEAAAVKGK